MPLRHEKPPRAAVQAGQMGRLRELIGCIQHDNHDFELDLAKEMAKLEQSQIKVRRWLRQIKVGTIRSSFELDLFLLLNLDVVNATTSFKTARGIYY
jgi:hypothetical protein